MAKNRFFSNYSSDVKHNFLFNWADGALFVFAMTLVSRVTVLPVFVRRLGGSNLLVGLIQVIWILGFNVPQVLMAGYTRTLPYKKPIVLKTSLLQRLPWLLLALFSLLIVDRIPDSLALFFFFICFALSAVGGSLNMPGWFDLFAKVTPVRIRGRLLAARVFLGSLLGVAAGGIVKYVLSNFSYPNNFTLLFFSAFGIMLISYIFLVLIKENEPNPSVRKKRWGNILEQLSDIIKNEPNFRNFLIADALLTTALMSNGFYSLQALKRLQLPDDYVGYFTVVFMVSMIIWNLIIGWTGDKWGHRLNLLAAAGAVFFASILALFAKSLWLFMPVFLAIALTQSVIHVSRLAIIAELSKEKDRSTYVSLTNLVTSPFILFGLLGGWLADKLGYEAVFIISAGASMAAAIVWIFFVKEPRAENRINYDIDYKEQVND
ncbi:MAG: MFS transporter [Candidatus Marinimicrobia bacterium]|nr:MFS transporter [Candidatus Neomarinimicrobiota bacterium]